MQFKELMTGLMTLLGEMSPDERLAKLSEIRQALNRISPVNMHPIDFVQWVHIDRVTPNDYNPNSVARTEMGLLYTSISHDGYTQPVVTVYDPVNDKFVIVDGFHRYYTMKTNSDIYATTGGFLPIVVIDKSMNDRMAATVRHNRARGSHSVAGMGNLVFSMLDNGWAQTDICNELGMDAEEVLRLQHVTGFSKLFADVEYKRAWMTRRQLKIEQDAGIKVTSAT